MALNEEFKLVDIERFASEMEHLQEIFADLLEIESSDDLKEAHLVQQAQTQQRLEGANWGCVAHLFEEVSTVLAGSHAGNCG